MTDPFDIPAEPSDPQFDLSRFSPYRVALAAQLLSETLARVYRARFGLSIPDWRVMVHLSQSGRASVRDIEAKVVMEKSKVSRAAARLEGRGLIAKRQSESDKRLVDLTLTDAGQAMMDELLPLAAQFQRRIEAQLGTDFAGFDAALSRIIEAYHDSSL
ncbi:MarR family winged helix-turn-helix transcriptional regulator [Primorskyibacter aestuariivivens]|uniref:MarR family winged helix-turn-helix transcriptional regulator n=1 Tax=Primorskyibacter aestuariivivens TaxID=1888912 RepID=UPI00230079A3|nr:MarR family winged helix-turn-helix transcriptional regulator [Primorskyibacter aestuariivivens]MDA7430354.1 MarR family winged helix-turn-helix transcriptional regulator [Primorskyibacter aestuariivivens]